MDLARVWLSKSGSMGASPTSPLVTSTAQISSVWSLNPRWTFRQTRGGPSTRPEVDLPPGAAVWPSMPVCIPFAFALNLNLDRRAVDQQLQRSLRPPMWDIHGQCRPATAERAEIRHIPVQADQARQAPDKVSRQPRRHSEQSLHWQADPDDSVAANSLDGSVAANRRSPTRACRLRSPRHVRIKPDPKRSEAYERLVAGGPVQGLAGRCVRSAHPPKLSPKL